MMFSFAVGHSVEYRALGQAPGLYEVIRHMPEEDGAARKYRIKSLQEGFERTVAEHDLQPADLTAGAYKPLVKLGRSANR